MTRSALYVVISAGLLACSDSRSASANGAASTLAGPVPSGTVMMASIQQTVSSDSSKVGGQVAAILSLNVLDRAGRTVIPGGSSIVLTIAKLVPPRSGGAIDGVITLDLKAVTIGDKIYTPSADVGAVPHRLVGAETSTQGRGLIVSPGTPIAITLTQPLKITAN